LFVAEITWLIQTKKLHFTYPFGAHIFIGGLLRGNLQCIARL